MISRTGRWWLAAGALAVAPVAVMAADIVDTAKADGHFGMMLKAGEAAGVASWLKSPGPITVFAPTDDAFAKVPKAMRDDLMKPANLNKLKLTMGIWRIKCYCRSHWLVAVASRP